MKKLALLLPLLALAAAPALAEPVPPLLPENGCVRSGAGRVLDGKLSQLLAPAHAEDTATNAPSISVSRCFEPADREAETEDLYSPIVPVLAVGIFPPVQIGSEDASVLGVRLSLPYAKHAGVIGIDAGIVNDAGYLAGVQIGLVNLAEEFHGLQLGVFNYSEGDVLGGAQIGLFNKCDHGVCGLQAGLINFCNKLEGVQIGLINTAERLEGFQLGLINMTSSLYGVQLGAANMEMYENCIALPFLNVRF